MSDSNLLNMKRRSPREKVLSKRVKQLWQKSKSKSDLPLKPWVRQSDDGDAKAWLQLKAAKPVKKVRVKFAKKSKAEKGAEKETAKKKK